MSLLLALLAAFLAGATLLPASRSHAWWVRMWDFPRIQVALAQVVVLVAAPFVLSGVLLWVVVLAMAAGAVLHLAHIRPYTPFARREMRFARPRGDGNEVKLLAANVLMENERHDLVRDLIAREDPDVLLLMETDARWLAALRPALARYPTVLAEPKDDCYGMVLATRLPCLELEMVHLTADGTPSVWAEMRTPGGRLFRFVGLHPEPPVPGVDTDERDTQVLYAARFARRSDVPLVVMGDFNDAAWSHSSRLFKHYGRYLDPRVGRGLYASFHATNPLIRCAIDQLFLTEDLAVTDFRLGPYTGSDHFPVLARIRVDAEEARELNAQPPPMSEEERAEIDLRVEEYRAGLLKDRPQQTPATR